MRLAMREFGPRPTLGELQQQRLGYGYGVSVASIARRWLALSRSSCGGRKRQVTSYKLRAGARCTCCGGKGVTVQRPGWADNNIGFYPFPTTIADEMREEYRQRVLGD